jgi:hypothetical protein
VCSYRQRDFAYRVLPVVPQRSLDTEINQEHKGKGKTLAFFIAFTQKHVYVTMT